MRDPETAMRKSPWIIVTISNPTDFQRDHVVTICIDLVVDYFPVACRVVPKKLNQLFQPDGPARFAWESWVALDKKSDFSVWAGHRWQIAIGESLGVSCR